MHTNFNNCSITFKEKKLERMFISLQGDKQSYLVKKQVELIYQVHVQFEIQLNIGECRKLGGRRILCIILKGKIAVCYYQSAFYSSLG